jgi:hypothetical protein
MFQAISSLSQHHLRHLRRRYQIHFRLLLLLHRLQRLDTPQHCLLNLQHCLAQQYLIPQSKIRQQIPRRRPNLQTRR